MNRSMPGLPVHHRLQEFTQTHVHGVSDAIQPSHPLSSPSPPAPLGRCCCHWPSAGVRLPGSRAGPGSPPGWPASSLLRAVCLQHTVPRGLRTSEEGRAGHVWPRGQVLAGARRPWSWQCGQAPGGLPPLRGALNQPSPHAAVSTPAQVAPRGTVPQQAQVGGGEDPHASLGKPRPGSPVLPLEGAAVMVASPAGRPWARER